MGDSVPPEWLSTALEKYKAHRTATLELEKAAQHTLTFGGATIGILLAGGVNAWEQRLPATLLFLVVIPLVSCVIGIQWAGQMAGLGRESRYLVVIEAAIRDAYGPLPAGAGLPAALFTWERQKRESISPAWWRPDWRWQSSAAVVAFGIVASGSLVLGAYRGYDEHELLTMIVAVAEAAGLAAVCILLLRRLGRGGRGRAGGATTQATTETTAEPDRAAQ